jgi:3' terminal RNA ribose 2'-O-methyltransferase Hen1
MLLTITTTHHPATDLGFLLAKNPARVHQFALPFGTAHVFYPEADTERCTAALLLDIDPVMLVRGRGEAGGLLDQYVNDRPYAASSFLSVALAEVFGTALNGRSRERPELAATAIPLVAHLPAVPARGGPAIIRRIFEPLGYAIEIGEHPLDPQFPAWGAARVVSLTLTGTVRLADLLAHLYVLVPVLDANKHYYFGDDEIQKLLRRGEGWLANHPERDLITTRYLKRRPLVRAALAQLVAEEEPVESSDEESVAPEEPPAPRLNLHTQRLIAVVEALRSAGARSVIDLGCGEGRLLRLLQAERQFERIGAMDVSYRAVETARDVLRLDRLAPAQAQRFTLFHGSLLYRDERLHGYDAAAVVEVIEHLDPARLAAFERVVFANARPGVVVLTTPNVEYNVRFPTLTAGALRHADHRFEWTRAEFAAWCARVAAENGYSVTIAPVGPEDADVGAPSQLAVFTRQ